MSNLLHTIHVHAPTIQFDLISDQDAVLLWQDGVLISLKNNPILAQLKQQTIHIYALENDLLARGLVDLIDQDVILTRLPEVVELTQSYFPQKCWY